MFNLVFKVSKWFLNKPIIVRDNYARELLSDPGFMSEATVITSPNAWKYFLNSCAIKSHDSVIMNPPLEISEINEKVPRVTTKWVIGVGGGRIMDITKYLGFRDKCKVCLIPTVLSTTSWMNMAIALREDHVLKFPGEKHANMIIVDPELIEKSPAELSFGGLADLLASASALGDWKLANERKNDKISQNGVQAFLTYIDKTLQSDNKLMPYSRNSVRYIYESFLEGLSLCGASMSGRPVEGSEHFLYYCLDEQNSKNFIHGQIISLSMLICLKLQGSNALVDPNKIKVFLDKIQVRFRLQDQGLSRNELQKAIQSMGEFVIKRNLPYSIWNEPNLFPTQKSIEDLLDWVQNL